MISHGSDCKKARSFRTRFVSDDCAQMIYDSLYNQFDKKQYRRFHSENDGI